MPRMSIARFALLVGWAMVPGQFHAQSPARRAPITRPQAIAVAGVVVDTAGHPVTAAEVVLLTRGVERASVSTDTLGRFTLSMSTNGVPTLRVRRMGYEPRIVPVVVTGGVVRPITIVLDEQRAAPDTAPAAEAGDPHLAEFVARASSNRYGHFIGAEAVAAMHATLASDILRHVPGVVVRPARGIGNTVRIRGCAPLIWVEGQQARGAELDELVVGRDVAAVEVYSSTAGVPVEYADRSATCGTILVWLRTH